MFCLPTATRDLMQHQIVVSDSLGLLEKEKKKKKASKPEIKIVT